MSSEVIPVRVYVRARPFSKREKNENAAPCLTFYIESNQVVCNGKTFAFDSVMDPTTSQSTAYEVATGDLIEKLLQGFNCTIIAYGQTGSGKTFSMGTEETTQSMKSDSRGIIPRLVDKLFETIVASEHSSSFQVSVSMLEIYDEKVNDLLSSTKDLQIREQNGTVLVQGLKRQPVSTLETTMEQLEIGCQLRSKGETAMNAKSSRSHAIFTISVDKAAVDETDNGFKAKLHLVDLAGSERLKKTQAEGERMREGININQGLLALGNVISALSEPGNNKHIPYRDSKITRLLQDSLGGNSYTVMIACISPADSNAEETLSTLRYADRAKKIKNKPIVNEDAEQKSLVKHLQEKIRRLENELAEKVIGEGAMDSGVKADEFLRLQRDYEDTQRQLVECQSKAAEAFYQKVALHRQLTVLEAEKDKLRNVVCDDLDEKDATAILQSIKEMLDLEKENAVRDETAIKACDNDTDGDEDMEIDEQFGADYLTRQSQLEDELNDIQDQIRRRQKDVELSNVERERLARIMEQTEAEKAALQSQLHSMEESMKQMKDELKKTSTSGKLAEDRRQKVKALENEISQLKKRLTDLKRMENQKKDLEQKTQKMSAEIQGLKQQQVANIKKSKEVAEQYRLQKVKYDRQLAQLQAQERKKDLAHAKKERENEKKMDVLRKKLEESSRVNKRLIAYQNKRTQLNEENTKDTKNIKKFLKEELAACLAFNTATQTYQALVESRASSSKLADNKRKEIRKAKARLDEAVDERNENNIGYFQEKINFLESELQFTESEIAKATEMINVLGDQKTQYEPELRADERWKNVATVSHAKCVLKSIFDMLVECSEQKKEHEDAAEAAISEYKEKLRKLKSEKTQLETMYKKKFQEILDFKDKMKKDLSEQLMFLSSSLAQKASSDGAILELENFHDRLDEATNEIAEAVSDAVQDVHARRSTRNTKIKRYGDVVNSQDAIPATPQLARWASKQHTSIADKFSPIVASPIKRKSSRNSQLFKEPPLKGIHSDSVAPLSQNLNATITIDSDNGENSPAIGANTTFVLDGKEASAGKKRNSESSTDVPPLKISHRQEHDISLGGIPR